MMGHSAKQRGSHHEHDEGVLGVGSGTERQGAGESWMAAGSEAPASGGVGGRDHDSHASSVRVGGCRSEATDDVDGRIKAAS